MFGGSSIRSLQERKRFPLCIVEGRTLPIWRFKGYHPCHQASSVAVIVSREYRYYPWLEYYCKVMCTVQSRGENIPTSGKAIPRICPDAGVTKLGYKYLHVGQFLPINLYKISCIEKLSLISWSDSTHLVRKNIEKKKQVQLINLP